MKNGGSALIHLVLLMRTIGLAVTGVPAIAQEDAAPASTDEISDRLRFH